MEDGMYNADLVKCKYWSTQEGVGGQNLVKCGHVVVK